MSKTMLIIEDDVVTRDLLCLVFEHDGFNCVQAENGEAGLAMLESVRFDFIILDNVMPKMTGLEFLLYRQGKPQTTEIPIIMITRFLDSDVREQATKLGVYAIVGKPYDISELRGLVNQISASKPSDNQVIASLQI